MGFFDRQSRDDDDPPPIMRFGVKDIDCTHGREVVLSRSKRGGRGNRGGEALRLDVIEIEQERWRSRPLGFATGLTCSYDKKLCLLPRENSHIAHPGTTGLHIPDLFHLIGLS